MEQKENTGVLFKVTDKQSEKHPDMTGKCKVNGREMELAGWENTSKNGKHRYLSVKFSEPFVATEKTTAKSDEPLPF